MKPSPEPPLTALPALASQLSSVGWAMPGSDALRMLAQAQASTLAALQPLWQPLASDPHLRDRGRYRRRRHGCFVVEGTNCHAVPQRPHWRPVEYNALHGGIQRHFDPLPDSLLADPARPRLLVALSGVASQLRQPGAWFVEAHPFGIDATGGIGRPTPEPQDPLLPSWRDTFVLSFRRGGFQGPQQAPTP